MIVVIITTVDSKNAAENIADILVKERLAACVSIMPATSIYRRKGKIEKADESLLIIKTTPSKASAAIKRLKEIHPYELPEILVFKADASKEYASRVEESTK